MGANPSKRTAQMMSIDKVTSKMLRNTGGKYIISPQLCTHVLKAKIKSKTEIRATDLQSVSKMIKVQPAQILKSEASSSKERSILEREIGLALFKKQSALSWRSKLHLKARIHDLKTNSSGLPMENLVLKTLQSLSRLPLAVELYLFLRSFFTDNSHFSIDAKDLRKGPAARVLASSKPGLDIAHILSLSLSVTLWKQVMGTDLISVQDRRSLKYALAHPCNLQVVCQHTNRVLHVNYDSEIAAKLKEKKECEKNEKKKVSIGARRRLKQIIKVNQLLAVEFPNVKEFFVKSNALLKALL